MDEPPAPVHARDDRGWNGPEPPGVVFTYGPGRSGTYAPEILRGFEGILQVDGYAGYNRVLDLRTKASNRSQPFTGSRNRHAAHQPRIAWCCAKPKAQPR